MGIWNNLKRRLDYGQAAISKTGGKLASKAGAHKLQLAMERSFASKLSGMRGVPAKAAQILAMTGDDEQRAIHEKALAQIEAMSQSEVKTLIKNSLPTAHQEIELTNESCQASLGQVNRAKFKGRQIALKMRYSDAEANMQLDQQAMQLLCSSFSTFKRGFRMQEYQTSMQEELYEELDYRREAQLQQQVFDIFSTQADICIPQLLPELCGDNIIGMSWEDSMSPADFANVARPQDFSRASDLVTQFYLTLILEHGIIPADPNPGNFGFRRNRNGEVQLVIFDFGSYRQLPQEKHLALVGLARSIVLEEGNCAPWLKLLGYDMPLLQPIAERLPAFLSVIFEPFSLPMRYELKHWNRKQRSEDILGEDRFQFMLAAPADLIFFIRALHGIFYYNDFLGGKIYARPHFDSAFKIWQKELNAVKLPFLGEELQTGKMATQLRVQVKENGSIKVALTFNRHAVDDLHNIIDEEIQQKIISHGENLNEILRRVRRSGYCPQQVFLLHDEKKEILVELR